jgi:uncharacterized RDD family membrane protein YckC
MKCPKCGYLGFETTDRCRNCQYDFSLAPFASDPELTLHGADRKHEGAPADFELPPIARQSDTLSATALDLDRLFGDPEPPRSAPPPVAPVVARQPEPEPDPEPMITLIEPEDEPVPALSMAAEEAEAEALPPPVMTAAEMIERAPREASAPPPAMAMHMDAPADDSALPFDDAPLVPPPAARPPLAVRRSTPEVPRNRPRTTRPIKTDSLDFEPAAPKSSVAARAATETVALLSEMPSLGVRVGAGAIDLLLLVGIDAAVLYLTLRVTGLQNTLADLRVLPPVPFLGFLAILAFGYVASFTVAGGQTIGKMVLSLRVIGDDGRPVDAAGGMLRALGCMLVPITLGLSYLPALFTSDHRALHDRLAGTRVVQE